MVRNVLALIETLPTKEQEVVALCDWSGLTYEQTATALEVPVGTVKSRLSRAHAHLREILEDAAHSSSQHGEVNS
jgi:RNA polymerase sigma-70 factor (ECF subfamily)